MTAAVPTYLPDVVAFHGAYLAKFRNENLRLLRARALPLELKSFLSSRTVANVHGKKKKMVEGQRVVSSRTNRGGSDDHLGPGGGA